MEASDHNSRQAYSPEKTSRGSHRRIWRQGCAGVLGLLLLIPGWELYRGLRPPSSVHVELRKKLTEAEKEGLAVTLPAFHRKYPVSAQGAAAIQEAARITEHLKWDWSKIPKLPAEETTAAQAAIAFDLERLVATNTGGRPDTFTTATLLAHARQNEAVLDSLIALSKSVPLDELGWEPSFTKLAPFLELHVRLAASGDPGVYGRLRDSSRVLLPAAVYLALAEGETTRAYAVALSWSYLNRAQKVAGPSLLSSMFVVAPDILQMDVIAELLKAAPPADLESARRVYDALDPERLRRDWLRRCEAVVIFTNRFLFYLAGDHASAPSAYGDFRQRLKTDARLRLRQEFDTFRDNLAEPRPSWNPPRLTTLRRAYPELGRADIYEVAGLEAEWLIRFKGIAEAPGNRKAEKLARESENWAEHAARRNFMAGKILPTSLFPRSWPARTLRGALAKAAVLRGSVLVRMAELESSGTQAALPVSLEEVCKRLNEPVPLDPLADLTGTPIEYQPHPKGGTYTIRHKPNRKGYVGETPAEFRGRWNPAGR